MNHDRDRARPSEDALTTLDTPDVEEIERKERRSFFCPPKAAKATLP